MLAGIHHVAILCADYEKSKYFYTEVLGLEILAENYRSERDSYKLDLKLPDGSRLELFSAADAPARPSYPEALGLRHLAFSVTSIDQGVARLASFGIAAEAVRVDEYSGRKYTFFNDPDGLPLELYEL